MTENIIILVNDPDLTRKEKEYLQSLINELPKRRALRLDLEKHGWVREELGNTFVFLREMSPETKAEIKKVCEQNELEKMKQKRGNNA